MITRREIEVYWHRSMRFYQVCREELLCINRRLRTALPAVLREAPFTTASNQQSIQLDTARGNAIPNTQAQVISHPLAAQRLEQRVTAPSILRMRSHPRFNCHGLAFASRRTEILTDLNVTRILADDDYTRVPEDEVVPGDIAIYFAPDGTIDHSGVVCTKPSGIGNFPFVFSKWGSIGPEVYHRANDQTPGYSVSDIRYYRVCL